MCTLSAWENKIWRRIKLLPNRVRAFIFPWPSSHWTRKEFASCVMNTPIHSHVLHFWHSPVQRALNPLSTGPWSWVPHSRRQNPGWVCWPRRCAPGVWVVSGWSCSRLHGSPWSRWHPRYLGHLKPVITSIKFQPSENVIPKNINIWAIWQKWLQNRT